MLYLNNVLLPDPDDFEIKETEISKDKRMASGKMLKEVIAIKKTFIIEYDSIKPVDLEKLKTLRAVGDFMEFRYFDNEVEKTATVWFNPFDKKMKLTDSEFQGKYWGDIKLELEEQ